MPSATIFLLAGLVLAVSLGVVAWRRQRGPVSPGRSVDEFHAALRAIAPRNRGEKP